MTTHRTSIFGLALTSLLGALGVLSAAGAGCGGDVVSTVGDASTGDASTANGDGSSRTDGAPLTPPTAAPTSITFHDVDPTSGNVHGNLRIGKAADETGIATYNLYWGSDATTKLSLITSLPVTGADPTYILGSPIPAGASHLLAFSDNAAGESPTAAALALTDNVASFVDLSSLQGMDSGYFPTTLVDTTNQKLLITTSNDHLGLYPAGVFRCDLDGTNCAYVDVSNGLGNHTGEDEAGIIDATNDQLLVVANNTTSGSSVLTLYDCPLSDLGGADAGMACTAQGLNSGPGYGGGPIRLALDPTSGNLLVSTRGVDGGAVATVATFTGSTPTGSTFHDISAGQGSNGAVDRAIAIDPINHKMLVAALNESNPDGGASLVLRYGVYRCEVDGTACSYVDISAGNPPAFESNVGALVDATNGYLLVVASGPASQAALYRCKLDNLSGAGAGSGCTFTDISVGRGAGSGGGAWPVIDPLSGQLLTIVENDANDRKLALIACDIDGTNCFYGDMSAGQGSMSGTLPSAAIDPINNRLVVGTTDVATSNALGLYMMGLQ